jgi:hypothetical protein
MQGLVEKLSAQVESLKQQETNQILALGRTQGAIKALQAVIVDVSEPGEQVASEVTRNDE